MNFHVVKWKEIWVPEKAIWILIAVLIKSLLGVGLCAEVFACTLSLKSYNKAIRKYYYYYPHFTVQRAKPVREQGI